MTIDAFTNLAFDRSSVRAEDVDGHMHVSMTPISKATVNPYNGSEIPDCEELGLDPNKAYNLLRDPKELAKAAASFNGKPLLFTHKPITSLEHDFEGTVGAVSGVKYEHPYLMAALDIWPGVAIDAIKSGEQKQLSSAYRYRADMTPGEYEGTKFDGVMRDIVGNHVALVREGRAGPDVVVGDSINGMKDIISMTKPAALSRTAIGAPIALAVLMKPKLAADAKIDWSPLFKGVTAKNFKASKSRMAADIKRQTIGKLAKDANVDDVLELLDKLEEVIPEMEVEQVNSVTSAENDTPQAAIDADDTALREFLKSIGVSDEDIDKACAMASAPVAAEDDHDPQGSYADGGTASGAAVVSAPGGSTGRGEETASSTTNNLTGDRKAMDAKIKDMERKLAASKTAMDQALVAERQNQRDIRDAERIVEADARVGQIKVACDSADDVYRAALTVMNVDVAELPKGAARAVYNAIPAKPLAPRALVAQDAAVTAEYERMFPNANRLKN